MDYMFSNNIVEIVAGTNNRISRAYMEADENVNNKSLQHIKNFITNIETISNKDNVKDSRITSSKGNIRNFSAYDSIEKSIDFLDKNLSGIDIVPTIKSVFETIKKYQPQYSEGYDKKSRLIILEYESAVYMLVTSIAMVMANNVDVVQNGSQIKIMKKEGSSYSIIPKTLKDLDKEISSKKHKDYLDALLQLATKKPVDTNLKESVYTEGTVGEVMDAVEGLLFGTQKLIQGVKLAISTAKASVFGIVPIIRSVAFLRYKKKADTIESLEQQVTLLQNNIEQLKNIKDTDEGRRKRIIKRQEAYVQAYKKKAEKLRAELLETEKDTSKELKQNNPSMASTTSTSTSSNSQSSSDDDFVLESLRYL